MYLSVKFALSTTREVIVFVTNVSTISDACLKVTESIDIRRTIYVNCRNQSLSKVIILTGASINLRKHTFGLMSETQDLSLRIT